MTDDRKKRITDSFPDKYEEMRLNLKLTSLEFEKLKQGIYASSTEEKWNIFLFENEMIWSRSWTDYCIYKVSYVQLNGGIELRAMKVSRNPDEYDSTDLNFDFGIFKKMLNFYLL